MITPPYWTIAAAHRSAQLTAMVADHLDGLALRLALRRNWAARARTVIAQAAATAQETETP